MAITKNNSMKPSDHITMSEAEIIYNSFMTQAKSAAERDLLAWAREPLVGMATSEDGLHEMAMSGATLREYMRVDLHYRLCEQIRDMAEDQNGLPSYREALSTSRIASRLAARII
jgi:hypothetical protein